MAELEGDEDDAAASAQVIDLMQVLRDSLGARAGTSAAAAAPDASAPARKSAAKKSAPKEPAAKKAAAKKTKRAAD